jgi:predicted membrane protein
MCFLKTFGRLGGLIALIVLIAALLKQLVTLVGFLLIAIKVAIVVIFFAVLVMIALAIFRDRSRKRREIDDI